MPAPASSAGSEVAIAVVGAGVVGLAIAHRLAGAGHEVAVIDPAPPGSGASYGNAGTIADYAVLPVGTPSVLRDLPRLLFDRNSPLALRHAALPTLAPWLVRFLRQSLPGPARRNAQALAVLLSDATPLWRDLARGIGGSHLIRQRGALYLYDSKARIRAAGSDLAHRRALGVELELIGEEEVGQLEPGLPPFAGGAYFPGTLSLADPGEMIRHLAEAAWHAGARFVSAKAERIERGARGVTLTGPGLHLRAARVVIAAGAHSRGLARQVGDRIPLDTERGYHLEWDMANVPVTRPCCPTERGFYFCPMLGRLRVAGTVELGGLRAPASPHRLRQLDRGARAILPALGPADRDWMGFRPSIPDSLPVIGPSRGGDEVVLAFGHGHLGLTLAPVTARFVADLIAGRDPGVAIEPCLPTRF